VHDSSAPFVEEGNFDGLLDAIAVAARENPRIVLHGHQPLTRLFGSVETLVALKPHLAWLRGEVLAAIRRGESRAAIQHANLIPPGLLERGAHVHLPFLVLRENVINPLRSERRLLAARHAGRRCVQGRFPRNGQRGDAYRGAYQRLMEKYRAS
jgi:hypothetical protein